MNMRPITIATGASSAQPGIDIGVMDVLTALDRPSLNDEHQIIRLLVLNNFAILLIQLNHVVCCGI